MWMARLLRHVSWFMLCMCLGALSGCASLRAVQTATLLEARPADLPTRVNLTATPFFAQTALQCGPAALATVLGAAGAAGLDVTPDALSSEVFVPGRGGSLQIEMLAAARRHGLVSTRIKPELTPLLREVAAGHPVLVLLNLGLSLYPMWHYAVVIGYDLDAGEVLLRSGATRELALPLATFEHTWARSQYWAFVALPPDVLPLTAAESAVVEGRVGFERVNSPKVARIAYQSALQRWPDNPVLGLGLGNTLFASGDVHAAAGMFQRMADQHDSAVAWNNLATARLKLGDITAARRAAVQAVRRAQTNEPSWLLATQATLVEVEQAVTSADTGH